MTPLKYRLSLLFICLFAFGDVSTKAEDRSIYNRTGAPKRLTLRQSSMNNAPIRSPVLQNNEKRTVDLPAERFGVEIEDISTGQSATQGVISFEDPRKNVANLVKQETKKAFTVRDPVSGELRVEVKTNAIYSFVYGSEDVDQNGLRLGVTFIAAARGVTITVVHPNMPSSHCFANDGQEMMLVPGDTIVSINGYEVVGLEGMIRAVASSPRRMRFQVIDGRSGELSELTTTLAW